VQQRILIWQHGQLKTNASIQALQAALPDPAALVWLDLQIEDHAEQVTALLASVFKLSHITIDTVEEQHERAKLVEGNGYFHLVVHGLGYNLDTAQASTPKLDIVFGKNFLITIHRVALDWLDRLYKDMHAGEAEENIMSRGIAFLLYTLLDTLVDSYFPVLETLDEQIDELEDAAVNAATNEVQKRIFQTKRALVQMRRVISPQVEVANSLVNRTGDLIPQKYEPYFADVHDHLVRSFEVIDSYRDLMSGLLDVYLSTISNRLNQVMKQLAIIATIFLPITFITGVFGQNFGFMPQVAWDKGYNFWIILAFMALVTIIQIWYFKRKQWL
jgi:magnesium transporter